MPLPGHETVALSSVHANDVAETVSEKAKLAEGMYDGSAGPDVIVGAGGVDAPDAIASVQTRTPALTTRTPTTTSESRRERKRLKRSPTHPRSPQQAIEPSGDMAAQQRRRSSL